MGIKLNKKIHELIVELCNACVYVNKLWGMY